MSKRDQRSKMIIRSLERGMAEAARAHEASNQMATYRFKPITVFAVQAADWKEVRVEIGRLFELIAPALEIDLTFLDTVKDWDNVPDEIYERYESLCPLDIPLLGGIEPDYLVIKSKTEGYDIGGSIHRGDWLVILPKGELTVIPDVAFQAIFSAKN